MEADYLLNYGALGIICGWFMFRMERIIKTNTDAINSFKDVVILYFTKKI